MTPVAYYYGGEGDGMTQRDWDMLLDPNLGDPLADIKEWMCPPYSDGDVGKWEPSSEKQGAMDRRKLGKDGSNCLKGAKSQGRVGEVTIEVE